MRRLHPDEAHRGTAGFTLVEAMVVVAVVGIVTAMAWSSFARGRPRARLAATSTELQAVIHQARQQALANGRDVAVLVYPAQQTGEGVGRVVVYLDGAGGFMSGAPPAGFPSFCTFSAETLGTQSPSDVLGSVDIPQQVAIAPPARAVVLPFPYNKVPLPAPLPATTGCSFCGADRGAIRFDARGRASFFSTCGAPGNFPDGGSISLTSDEVSGSRLLVVTPYGGVRFFDAE